MKMIHWWGVYLGGRETEEGRRETTTPPRPERKGALIGRAGFDVVRLMLMRDPCPQGSQNVIPGNLGERFGEMGALKREASNDHL